MAPRMRCGSSPVSPPSLLPGREGTPAQAKKGSEVLRKCFGSASEMFRKCFGLTRRPRHMAGAAKGSATGATEHWRGLRRTPSHYGIEQPCARGAPAVDGCLLQVSWRLPWGCQSNSSASPPAVPTFWSVGDELRRVPGRAQRSGTRCRAVAQVASCASSSWRWIASPGAKARACSTVAIARAWSPVR